MRIIGCDLHARQQTLAMLDTTTGEVEEVTLKHEGNNVREFYFSLSRPVRVGIEATGSMQWFVNLMEELGIECLVGHPAQIRASAPRKQKNDRRDAELILKMLVEDRFPAIWLPSKELQDLRALLRHRHQWVRLRTRIQNALQSIALANGLRRGTALWSHDGQSRIASLPLTPHTAYRRSELQAMYEKFEAEIEKLNQRVEQQAGKRPGARLLMTHPGVGPITALATEVFLGDPARFADSKALASYVGMIPREYSSGDRQRLGGLSKQGNPLLRFLWGEAGAHAARSRFALAVPLMASNVVLGGRKIREIPDIYSSGSSLRMSRSSVCCFVTRSVPPKFVSLEITMKEDDESKGELWLIALFLVLFALVVLRSLRH
jgi:transposase